MKTFVSAVILTKNEESYIMGCLESLSWCDEIVIVDDYSTDKTVQVARQARPTGIVIVQRHLQADFASQRNYGLEKASGELVFFVDADERVNRELSDEIGQLKLKEGFADTNGWFVKRQDKIFGKTLQHGETAHTKFLRLGRKNCGIWKGKVHEVWEIEGKIDQLNAPISHTPHPTSWAFLNKINWYTDIVAQYWIEQGREVRAWEIVFYPLGKFLQNYIVRLGFLDGVPGLIVAFMMSFHSFLARAKTWLRVNSRTHE